MNTIFLGLIGLQKGLIGYLDGVIYNSMNLVGNERLEAAARSINRPQILKLNLATGGDWASDAGDYLADDNTSMTVDWIRWSQNKKAKRRLQKLGMLMLQNFTGITDIVIKKEQIMMFCLMYK